MIRNPRRELFEERALLVATRRPMSGPISPEESIAELRLLTLSAGLSVVRESILRLSRPSAHTFIGIGQAEQLKEEADAENANLVIFDDALTPSQNRVLEELIDRRVIDRTGLILDIFAQRAKTKEGQLQVELAQLTYLQPRLVGMWSHFGRIKGGIGLRGPGETQLEIDRRRVRERMGYLRGELKHVRRVRATQRRQRQAVPVPVVALIGYTNSGKSTLLNTLTHADVPAVDLLFATLDPTIRRLRIPSFGDVLISDTVGFIRKLPHELVESFRATLEEVEEADLLIHVIDASHPHFEHHMESVAGVLRELEVIEKPTLKLYNKADLLSDQECRAIERRNDGVLISAAKGAGLEILMQAIQELLRQILDRRTVTVRIPLRDGETIARLRSSMGVREEEYTESTAELTLDLDARWIQWLSERGYEVHR